MSLTLFLITQLLRHVVVHCQEGLGLPEVFSSGVIFSELDVPLYDVVLPLIYQYKAPDWLTQRQLSSGIPTCTNDKYGEGNKTYLCPVFYHIQNELNEQLEAAMGLPQFTNSAHESDAEVFFSCDTISKHFTSSRLRADKLSLYLDRLKRCAVASFSSSLITSYSSKLSTVYTTIISRYSEEFSSKLRLGSRKRQSSELVEKLSLSGLLSSHYLAQISRWRRAFGDCSKGFIPESLLPSSSLRNGLESLSRKLAGRSNLNLTLNFGHSEQEISGYYNLQVADCVFSGNKFYLRILVPATKQRLAPLKLLNIKPLPFYKKENEDTQLCMISGFPAKFVASIEDRGSFGVVSTGTKIECEGGNLKLCKVPGSDESLFELDAVTNCGRALILYDYEPNVENEAKVVASCPLVCGELRAQRFPIVLSQKGDYLGTIYAIPDPFMGLEYKCMINLDGEEEEVGFVIPGIDRGLLGLTLPCGCRMAVGASVLRPPKENCFRSKLNISESILMFQLLPFQFELGTKKEKEQVNTPAPIIDSDEAA